MYFAVHAALGDDSLDDDISTTRSPNDDMSTTRSPRAKAEKAKKPTGTRRKVCFSLRPTLVESSLIFLCRNKPLQHFLLSLSTLSTRDWD
jgi:hypothetical protein